MAAAPKDLKQLALLLCGGGSRGVMEVWFNRALREQGIAIDFILECLETDRALLK